MWDPNQARLDFALSPPGLAGCGCLSWCCLDEPRSPQSQMVPLFAPFWHIFVPFLFPPCMNQQAQGLRFPPAACFPKFPSFLLCWAAELRSQVCAWLWDGAGTAINPVNPPSLGKYSNEIIANKTLYIYYLFLMLCHKLSLFPNQTWFSYLFFSFPLNTQQVITSGVLQGWLAESPLL